MRIDRTDRVRLLPRQDTSRERVRRTRARPRRPDGDADHQITRGAEWRAAVGVGAQRRAAVARREACREAAVARRAAAAHDRSAREWPWLRGIGCDEGGGFAEAAGHAGKPERVRRASFSDQNGLEYTKQVTTTDTRA